MLDVSGNVPQAGNGLVHVRVPVMQMILLEIIQCSGDKIFQILNFSYLIKFSMLNIMDTSNANDVENKEPLTVQEKLTQYAIINMYELIMGFVAGTIMNEIAYYIIPYLYRTRPKIPREVQ